MNIIEFGDCRETLRRWAAAGVKVQTCITSPPYFGLRDYGVSPSKWEAASYRTLGGSVDVPAMECCLGLEPTPDTFIGHMVEVLRAVRDVLADDGTLWLNIGDSYCSRPNGSIGKESRLEGQFTSHTEFRRAHSLRKIGVPEGLKHKDLIGIPWMLAFALRADGWHLRQENIWNKSNAMPESVTDRCTKAHESLFLLAKSERYYFDHEAIKEPANLTGKGFANGFRGGAYVDGSTFDNAKGGKRTSAGNIGARSKRDSFKRKGSKRAEVIPGQSVGTHRPEREEGQWDTATRNKRSVWTIATRPYKGAHFATFPPDLVEPCILAGSRPGDLVLDPFMGSGTTAAVALQHGRRYLGCELNHEYGPLQQERVAAAAAAVAAAANDSRMKQMDLLKFAGVA